MATFNKFQDFVEQLGKGVHQLHAAGHTLKVFLTNEAPGNLNTPRINNVAADGSLDLAIGSGDGLAWYRIVRSTFTGNASCTDGDSGYWVANVISFKEITAAVKALPPQLLTPQQSIQHMLVR
jgi:hypothetical protein